MATVNSTLYLWLLRVLELMEFEIGDLTRETQLGSAPLGLSDLEIDVELRDTLNEMFQDILKKAVPSGTWRGTSTLGDVLKTLTDSLLLKKIDELRDFAQSVVDATLTGCGITSATIPEKDRPQVRDCLNKELRQQPFLLRPIALADLEGQRQTVIDSVLKRMLA
jgi:hypothetical protein